MPFLSEDGTRNTFVLNVNRYVGLNKHLEEAGNEQKLEDALHVMEVLSTVEGMQALNSLYSDTPFLPLKDHTVNSNGYYADIQDQINSGATAPLIYNGWENIIVAIGESMISFVTGESTLDDVVSTIDGNQHLIWDNSTQYYTTVTQKIDTKHCSKLVGICFAEASGADMALISMNKWYRMDDSGDLNLDGVSGALSRCPCPIRRSPPSSPPAGARTSRPSLSPASASRNSPRQIMTAPATASIPSPMRSSRPRALSSTMPFTPSPSQA